MNKFIVVIHGIGDQRRGETARSAAAEYSRLYGEPIAMEPLGFFSIGANGTVIVRELTFRTQGAAPAFKLGFAEVYWADVPRDTASRHDTLDEPKYWGRTVASRAHKLYYATQNTRKLQVFKEAQFRHAENVIDELVESIAVLENLLGLAAKAGVFKFNLGPILDQYVAGVQLVADFQPYRGVIVDRVHSALTQVVAQGKKKVLDGADPLEIYIVAHSEGTVVGLIAILEALMKPANRSRIGAPKGAQCDWINYVKGFMTFGSPLDKHVLLWPELWEDIGLPGYPKQKNAKHAPDVFDAEKIETMKEQIVWCNYYDDSDPIGFDLVATRDYLDVLQCKAFDTGPKNAPTDYGFSRYWMPGAAHLGYWTDPGVFGHFAEQVVLKNQPWNNSTLGSPQSKTMVCAFSPWIPYLLAFLIHIVAVTALFSALIQTLHSGATALNFWQPRAVIGLSIVWFALTVVARLPRLAGRKSWLAWGLSLVAVAVGWKANTISFSGSWVPGDIAPILNTYLPRGAFVVALLSWCSPIASRVGRRVLIGGGAALSLAIIAMVGAGLHIVPDKSLWTAALAWLGFIYLWWIGVAMFDLTFIWHRHIRHSASLQTMRDWVNPGGPRPRRSWFCQ